MTPQPTLRLADHLLLATLCTEPLPAAQIAPALQLFAAANAAERRDLVRGLWGTLDPRVRTVLARHAVQDPDAQVRQACVQAALVDPDFPQEALARALQDPTSQVRAAAVAALRDAGLDHEALRDRLLDSEPEVAALARARLMEVGADATPPAAPTPGFLAWLAARKVAFASVCHAAFTPFVAATGAARAALRSAQEQVLEVLAQRMLAARLPTYGTYGPRTPRGGRVEAGVNVTPAARAADPELKPKSRTEVELQVADCAEGRLLVEFVVRDQVVARAVRGGWVLLSLAGTLIARPMRLPSTTREGLLEVTLHEPLPDTTARLEIDRATLGVELFSADWSGQG